MIPLAALVFVGGGPDHVPVGRLNSSIAAGKYKLRAQLGEGAHGIVYRARHVDLGRDVALKLLKPGVAREEARAKKRFLREVHLATSFVHRYAVTLRDFGCEEGLLYYTMDLVEGTTLQAAMKKEPIFETRRALTLAIQTLEALEEAHRAGVIHRDLKPGNLMLTHGPEGEEVRILDFGLAKAIRGQGHESQVEELTMVGARVGTLAYMSPEQAMGRELDARSDLYAVGVLLYMMLSGVRPCFPKRDAADPLQAFLFNLTTKVVTPLAEVNGTSWEISELVARALAKKPGDRFDDARSFHNALSRALLHLGRSSTGSGTGRLSSRRSGRRSEERKGLRKGTSSRLKSASRSSRGKRRRLKLPPGVSAGKVPGEYVNATDGSILLHVPPGTYRMGSTRAAPRASRDFSLPGERKSLGREKPVHAVTLTQDLFVGKSPVTWREYRRYCIEKGLKPPRTVDFHNLAGFDITVSHPAVNVNFSEATAYCEWAGGRLLTESEWEWAARGEEPGLSPWGDDLIDPRRGNWSRHPLYGGRGTSPVGAFPGGASPFGCLDMLGNVWEWTSDRYGEYPDLAQTDPSGPRGRRGRDERVARGGSWRCPGEWCTATSRLPVSAKQRLNWLGFRLCLPAPQ